MRKPVFLHEVLGHYGLKQIAGQTTGERNKFKLDLFRSLGGATRQAIADRYGVRQVLLTLRHQS